MAKGKQKAKRSTLNTVIERGEEEKAISPKELDNTCETRPNLEKGESSRQPSEEGEMVKLRGIKGGIDNQSLEKQTKTLSELLGVNTARKLDWSDLTTKTNSTASIWENFDAKRFKSAAVPLDYYELEDKDGKKIAKVQEKDLMPEIDYWKSSVLSFVLGASLPFKVMDAFYRRLWKHIGVDKVLVLPNGLYVIHFKTFEVAGEAVKEPITYLGSNPVIIKPWNVELLDSCNATKDKANFTRVLVDVEIQDHPPIIAHFVDESGKLVEQPVYYEWRPTFCSYCKNYGHGGEGCWKKEVDERCIVKQKEGMQRKVTVNQEWKHVSKHNKPVNTTGDVPKEEDMIQKAKGDVIQGCKGKEKVTTANPGFRILMEVDEEMQLIEGEKGDQQQLKLNQNHEEARVDAPYDPAGISDHSPILVQLDSGKVRKPVPFKFFNMWCLDEDFLRIVEKGWKQEGQGAKMYQVVRKLKRLKTDLKQLNRTKFADIQLKVDQLRERLLQLQEKLSSRPQDEELQEKEKEAYQEFIQVPIPESKGTMDQAG
ncbi:OLC1v1031323C1 [Oldenlandia corymbosa var. corymbosa]|uniref:OLC1v1031323C1 n=1 Tax=Oldenlandia corymbosa var. corymbosa TaxID=529605 RepID=A0AAV1CI82_OLDCO|nr:OLC1v1031323C1 [Oldenlandia corymbosa var. corymbosa]